MRRSLTNIATWSCFTVLLLLIIAFGGGTGSAAQLTAALSILALAVHAVIALGWVEATVFAAICLTVTFVMENIGVLTGFPFGRYTFIVGRDMPHIGVIPMIVGPLYFGMGYASWVIASLLIGFRVERPQSVYALIAVPLISAFVMTQWDVVMDPSASTLSGAWIWYNSGGYFGVPLSNFLGWLLVTWLYFQGFAIYSYKRRRHDAYPLFYRLFWSLPILLYLAAGLCRLPPLLASDSTLVDAAGHIWSAADIRETAVIAMLFTMVPTSLLALLRLVGPEGCRLSRKG
ncbi:carotenoid biosynthesis protein [Beijerinckia indica]|uniref:carotenoid biosynthesis protein n=1 Tax=Beijerinckia indica TaxID=533 RepID=UPI001FCAFC3B|nr:carotenoid biosynthesis protein [Beijerinckia indica]